MASDEQNAAEKSKDVFPFRRLPNGGWEATRDVSAGEVCTVEAAIASGAFQAGEAKDLEEAVKLEKRIRDLFKAQLNLLDDAAKCKAETGFVHAHISKEVNIRKKLVCLLFSQYAQKYRFLMDKCLWASEEHLATLDKLDNGGRFFKKCEREVDEKIDELNK